MELAVVVVAVLTGSLVAYAILRPKLAVALERATNLDARVSELQLTQDRLAAELAAKDSALLAASRELSALHASLQAEREAAEQKLALVQQTQQNFADSFEHLADKALKGNSAD